jgi:hypothetical protein
MSRNYKWFRSTALNYDPKLHMRHELDPVDLYVRFTSRLNPVLKRLVVLLDPVRRDKTLQKFANYADLWGAKDTGQRRESHRRLARKAPSKHLKRFRGGVGGCKSHRPERI